VQLPETKNRPLATKNSQSDPHPHCTPLYHAMEKIIYLDTETERLQDGPKSNLVPDLCLVQWSTGADPKNVKTCHVLDGISREFVDMVVDPDCHIVAHNASFDMYVLIKHGIITKRQALDKHLSGHVHCTRIGFLLHEISRGNEHNASSLSYVAEQAKLKFNKTLKNSDAKLFFSKTERPSEEQIEYAKQDVLLLPAIHNRFPHAETPFHTAAAFVLKEISVNGMHVDKARLAEEIAAARITKMRAADKCIQHGFVSDGRTKKQITDGVELVFKESRKRIQEVITSKVPRAHIKYTPTGVPQTSKDIIRDYIEFAPELQNCIDYANASSHLMHLEQIQDLDGDDRIHTSFNPVLNTTRTSSSGPNLQNISRDGGIRELFTAPPSRALVVVDFGALELHTLAEIIHYHFKTPGVLQLLLRNEIDPHSVLSMMIAEIVAPGVMKSHTVESFKKALKGDLSWIRRLSKAANFGIAGFMGAKSFVEYCSTSYNVTITQEQSEMIIDCYYSIYAEIKDYHKKIKNMPSAPTPPITFKQFPGLNSAVGVSRHSQSPSVLANFGFQALGARAAKMSLIGIMHETLERPSIKIVHFVHDEIVLECDEAEAPEVKDLLSRVMVEYGSCATPSIKLKVEGAHGASWHK
jgi:DNA polymerase I-like protein with 3'-5' exonuclease and polymerase domains